MKSCRLVVLCAVLLGSTAVAREGPDRKIVLECGSHPPIMANVSEAIRNSTYYASPEARQRILAIAKERCAKYPSAELTFVPRPQDGGTPQVSVATTANK